jgi:hypothetical protein
LVARRHNDEIRQGWQGSGRAGFVFSLMGITASVVVGVEIEAGCQAPVVRSQSPWFSAALGSAGVTSKAMIDNYLIYSQLWMLPKGHLGAQPGHSARGLDAIV